MSNYLTNDAKAIILLCGVLGKGDSGKPLTPREYNALVDWLITSKLRPEDLLEKENIEPAAKGSGIFQHRLESLLGRGVQLGFAVEEWQRNGIWIISRSDDDYPARLKTHLGKSAPPMLFGVGDRSLLAGGGLAIVGSRNVDEDGELFTKQVGVLCAQNRMPVVSGGARGVDQFAMSAALEAGGVSIGILAENLLRKSVEKNARKAIANGRLLLISACHPKAHFHVGSAMARNKYIYAMADFCLVVSAEHNKGGTWTGADEELKREVARPIFVRQGENVPKGNEKLLELGAIAWPEEFAQDSLQEWLREAAKERKPKAIQKKNMSLLDFQVTKEDGPAKEKEPQKQVDTEACVEITKETVTQDSNATIYDVVLPLLLNELEMPKGVDELVESLDVVKSQLNSWLKRAVEEQKIEKLTHPVRYRRVNSNS